MFRGPRWNCNTEGPGASDREGPCEEDEHRQKLRNCPRRDLGGPRTDNPNFEIGSGRSKCRICPVGVITERSAAFVDLFFQCHAVEPGMSGPVYRMLGWPSGGGLFDEYAVVVRAFEVIREEVFTITQAEAS